jgi:hypothetical protein
MNPWSPPQTNGSDIIPPVSDLQDDSLAPPVSTARPRVPVPVQKRRIPEEAIVVDPDSENDEADQNRRQGSSARQREIEQSTDQEVQPRGRRAAE